MKELELHDIHLVHRPRSLLVEQRTAVANRIPVLMPEYELAVAQALGQLRKQPPSPSRMLITA